MSDELRIEGQERTPSPEVAIWMLLARIEEIFRPRFTKEDVQELRTKLLEFRLRVRRISWGVNDDLDCFGGISRGAGNIYSWVEGKRRELQCQEILIQCHKCVHRRSRVRYWT